MKKSILVLTLSSALAVAVPSAFSSMSTEKRMMSAPMERVEEAGENGEIEWVTVNVESAGTLGVEVLYIFDKLTDVTSLKITGPLNASDWETIKGMTNIVNLDLSGASATDMPEKQFYYFASLETILLPDNLKSIGREAFYKTGIRSITVPKSVTSVGERCFFECKSLSVVDWQSSASVPEECFSQCSALEEINLSDEITTIDRYSFRYCAWLKSIRLPEKLSTIGYGAFMHNSRLEDVGFNEGSISISSYAFTEAKLTKVILPKNAWLSSDAFYNCKNIEEIVLPAQSQYSSYAFYNCPNLQKVTCPAATPPSGSPFSNISWTGVLTVPSFAVVNYKLHSDWRSFATIQGGYESDKWTIDGDLSLSNNRRMEGTPSITITANGRLTVGGNAPMAMDQFEINSNLNSGKYGQLINDCGSMTANDGTIYIYCNNQVWYFITLPCDVKLSDITHSKGSDFVFRHYDGASRGINGYGSNWKNVEADGILKAGKGYICQCYQSGWLNFKVSGDDLAPMFANGDRVTDIDANPSESAYNAGWNLIGNPYTSYFDLAATSLTCPVTVWDLSNRNYKAYSLIDDDVILAPHQSFFIQCPEGENSVNFAKSGRQLTSEVSRPAAAASNSGSNRMLYDIVLTGADNTTDRTRVVLNEDVTEDYEVNLDATKFFAPDMNVAAIYTTDKESHRLSINERPTGNNRVSLGLYFPAAGEWKLTTGRAAGTVTVRDNITGDSKVISETEPMIITAEEPGYIDGRYTLEFANIPTGMKLTASDAAGVSIEINGNVVTVKGAAGLDISIVTLDGKSVSGLENASGCETFALDAGVYIVACGDNRMKCVVR